MIILELLCRHGAQEFKLSDQSPRFSVGWPQIEVTEEEGGRFRILEDIGQSLLANPMTTRVALCALY